MSDDDYSTDLQIKSVRKQMKNIEESIANLESVMETLSKRLDRLNATVIDDGTGK